MSVVVTPSRRRVPVSAGRLLALVCGLAVVLALPAGARAAATRLVRYDGWQARVPASWPVFRLSGRGAATCVRFDRHAVYLGTPGGAQRCPVSAVGRTEALLVSPRAATTGSVPTTGDAASVIRGR